MASGSSAEASGLGRDSILSDGAVRRGVTMMTSSVSCRFQLDDLNRAPRIGTWPAQGTWLTALA